MNFSMEIEICIQCGGATGRGGRMDDSIYILYPDKKIGPLCEMCGKVLHWVCEKCGEGVYPENVTYEETHEGCGGRCS